MRRAGIAVLLLGGIFYFDTGSLEAFSIPKFAVMAFGLMLFWARRRGPLDGLRTNADAPLAALWLVSLAATATSVDPFVSFLGVYRQPFHGLIAMALLTLAFEAGALDPILAIESVFVLIPAAMIGVCAYGIAQGLGFVAPPWDAIGGRIVGTTGAPVFLGALMAVCAPICLTEAGDGRRKWLGAAGLAGVAITLALSKSAGGVAAAASGCFATMSASDRIRVGWRGVALAALAAVGLIAYRSNHGKAQSDSMRVAMLQVSARAAAERPLIGWGPDSYLLALRQERRSDFVETTGSPLHVQASAHNDIAQAAVTLGLIGLAAYLWLILVLARETRGMSYDYEGPAALGALTAAFVQAKVNPIPPEALIPVALLCGACCKATMEGFYENGLRIWSRRIAALALVLVCWRSYSADFLFGRGVALFNAGQFETAADFIRMAATSNPYELEYSQKRVEEIFLLTKRVTKLRAKQITKIGLRIAAENSMLHPMNPSAHELYASAALFAAGGEVIVPSGEHVVLPRESRLGPALIRDSRRESARAHELDPVFPVTIQFAMVKR